MKKINLFLGIFFIFFFASSLFSYQIDTRAIKYGTERQKINFIQKVFNTGDRTYLPEIAELLDDGSDEVRSKAAYTLFKIGDSTCVDYYKKGLKDNYWQVRYYSIKGLVKFATGKELDEFNKSLNDPYWQIRYYAASGIGKYGNENSVDVLVNHIDDGNEKVKEEILWALINLMWKPESREKFKTLPDSKVENIFNFLKGTNTDLKIRTIWLIEATGDKRGVPYLISALDDVNDEVKIRSVWALEKLKATESADEISGLLAKSSVKVKIESIKTLVRMKTEEGIKGIVKGLKDPDESVKIYSLWALEKFKNISTYPEIVNCLNDKSPSVREYAYKIIEEIKDPVFIPILEKFIDNENNSINSRLIALNLLGKIGDESVKSYLIEKTRTTDQLIRYGAIVSFSYLDKFDNDYLEILSYLEKNEKCKRVRDESRKILKDIVSEMVKKIKSPDPKDREFVINKVNAIIKTYEVKELIYKMLISDYPEVRSKAVRLVIEKPERFFSKGIEEALKSSDIETRKMAAIAIGEIGDRSAIPLLKKGLKHFDPEFQLYCAYALAKMGVKDAFPYAMNFINSSNSEYQKKAVEILSFLKDKRSTGILLQKLKDGELDVKLVSAYALAKMGEIKGLEFLVRISEQNIEPLRTEADMYLNSNSIPLSLKCKIPEIREKIYKEKLGVQEVIEKFMFAYRITGMIDVDGKDNDRYWQMVKKSNRFIRIEGEKVPYGIQTKVAAGYDDKNLYFLIICEDQSGSEINLNSRDFITISINPFNSENQWYQFVLHPLELIKYSYVWKFYVDNDEPERNWKSNWVAKSSVESNRWIAEISIPLSDLNVKEINSGDKWDINFLREINEKSTSTWTGRIDDPEQFGLLIFKESL